MKKILFLDRDGTIVSETDDEKVDSVDKLTFLPHAIHFLRKISTELDYELVMVSNQDGLGTPDLPNEDFWPVHNFIIKTLKNEGINFFNIHIDEHYEKDNHPNRKPGVGMLSEYLNNPLYDMKNSYVIGDRITDVLLAKNLGCKAIHISKKTETDAELTANNWERIYNYLITPHRKAEVRRQTTETIIYLGLLVDGAGKSEIDTGLGFFDHMLEQLAKHSGCDIEIEVDGDLHVDEHHTIEDTALALGEAFNKALGNKRGINRYGFLLPMDDALAQVAIDFSGRPWLVWDVNFNREKIGDVPTEMFPHFFKSFSDAARCNMNIKAEGKNEHHKIEAIFKAVAKSVKMAVKKDLRELENLPTTKGIL